MCVLFLFYYLEGILLYGLGVVQDDIFWLPHNNEEERRKKKIKVFPKGLNAIEEISAIPGAERLPANRHSCMASAIVIFFSSPFLFFYFFPLVCLVCRFLCYTHKSKSLQFYKLLYNVCQAYFISLLCFFFCPFSLFIELHIVRIVRRNRERPQIPRHKEC